MFQRRYDCKPIVSRYIRLVIEMALQGPFLSKKESDNHFIITAKVPYPDDLMYGLFYTYTRHFRPVGKGLTVHYDESAPHRDQGGESTVYHILIKN